MRKIKKIIGWAFLLCRRELRRPGIYLLAALLLLMLQVLQVLVIRDDQRLTYGVLNEGAGMGERIVSFLKEDPLYTLTEAPDRESLFRAVEAGRLDCGFVLTEKLNEASGASVPPGSIRYVCTTSTQRGAVLKEKVFAAALRETTRQMLTEIAAGGDVFSDKGEELSRELTEYYQEYLDGEDTLQILFETVETEETGADAAKKKAEPDPNQERVATVTAVLLFAAALVYGRARFSGESRTFTSSLRPGEGRLWRFLEILCPVLLLSLVMLICWFIRLAGRGELSLLTGLAAAGSFLAYAFLCALWSLVFSSLFRREGYYVSSIPLLLILSIVTSEALLFGIHPGRVLGTLRLLFPVHLLAGWLQVL